jgi:long-chain acyl-CoA synthetase
MEIKTLYELLQQGVKSFTSRIAFEMLNGEKVSFDEVGARATKVQEILVSAGLKPGDKVALLSSSMPNWGVCYMAVTAAGMVVVPILPDFAGHELDKIIAHSESKALLVSDKLFSKLSKQTIESLNVVVRTKNLAILSQRVFEQGAVGVPKPEDLASIIYTSGTTSSPKGVMLSHKAICAQVGIDYEIFPVDESDVFLSVLPLSHTYECSIGLLYAFVKGARVVYLDRQPTASVLMPAMKAIRPTIMLIVPLLIEKIYRHQVQAKFNSNAFWRTLVKVGFMRRYLYRVAGRKLQDVFGGRLRFLGIGGAKLDGQAEQFLLEARVPYAVGYGLTETAPLLAGAAPSQVRLGSTGPAAPGVQLRIENIDPETQQGEVVALTPSIMMGYYKNPEETAKVFTKDGWFRTGDLGCFSPDGWLYIKGRLKNMIVGPSGENIYPEEIESVLNSHVCIADSLVTEHEGRLIALVHFNREALEAKYEELKNDWELRKGAWEKRVEELKKEVLDYVNSQVNRFSRISEVVEEKEEFEMTPTKKIKRFLYNKRHNTKK